MLSYDRIIFNKECIMKKTTVPEKTNPDKKFVAHLMATLKAKGNKVDTQYLCSAPAPVRFEKN